jgi:hypothetical protein
MIKNVPGGPPKLRASQILHFSKKKKNLRFSHISTLYTCICFLKLEHVLKLSTTSAKMTKASLILSLSLEFLNVLKPVYTKCTKIRSPERISKRSRHR